MDRSCRHIDRQLGRVVGTGSGVRDGYVAEIAAGDRTLHAEFAVVF
jgi:hypothetical protein